MSFKLLEKAAVIIAAVALFFYMSLEITMATWSKPLMKEIFGGGADASAKAGIVLSLFGAAMTIGRFIASRIKNLTDIGARVIVLMSLVSLIGIIIMVLTKTPTIAILAILLTGLAFGPIFPNIVGITFAKFDPKLHGSIFGIIFTVGLLGSTFVPNFVGNLSAGGETVQQSLLIAAVMAGILLIIAWFIGRIGAPKKI
jgi:fucose permease